MRMRIRRALFAFVSASGAAMALELPAHAQTAAPAIAMIESFDHALLAATAPGGGGARTLSPAIDRAFNVPIMAQFVVGPTWRQLAEADQQSIIAALRRYVTARFAHDFAEGAAQTIVVDPAVQSRGLDQLVRTQATSPGEEPDRLDYRLRLYGNEWRVIDVYYNGVSELTTQRADAASALQTGGAAALVLRLQRSADALR